MFIIAIASHSFASNVRTNSWKQNAKSKYNQKGGLKNKMSKQYKKKLEELSRIFHLFIQENKEIILRYDKILKEALEIIESKNA